MVAKPAKKSLIAWASTVKARHGGGVCATCSWLQSKKEQNDSIVEELEELLQQIFKGQLGLSLADVARKLKADYGYRYTESAFTGHIRRCRTDLSQLKE